MMRFNAIDLFAGCGGLSQGLKKAGFDIIAAIELSGNPARAYKVNHKDTVLLEQDIRLVQPSLIKDLLQEKPLHLLAGCPPCQGFSSIRKLNRKDPVEDERNNLIWEYFRFIKELMPLTIMMENVPGLIDYPPFTEMISRLKQIGYSNIDYRTVWIQDYGVPQRRRRLVLLGSRVGKIEIPIGKKKYRTVRDCIGRIEKPENSKDPLHKIYPHHSEAIQQKIKMIPKDGGGRESLPIEYQLKCHMNENIGFSDIYGRLKWDSLSSTITGGCLSPSKGRFLHPDEDRCISAREAALLQTFPRSYYFPKELSHSSIALMIGNALPPKFSEAQGKALYNHINKYLLYQERIIV